MVLHPLLLTTFCLCLDTEDRPETADGEAGAWEGSTLVMLPEERGKKAWYGDPSHPWSSDHGKDVTESVLESLREKQQVRAWDASWGDPAPGGAQGSLASLGSDQVATSSGFLHATT